MAKRLRHLTPDESDKLGRFCAALLTTDDSWVRRRKEAVTVLDEATIHRRQSVDFTLDAINALSEFKDTCERIFGCGICAAPLFILEKKPARSLAFDLKDESGRSLSLMTKEENATTSAATLKVLCRQKLEAAKKELSDTLAWKLEQLAMADAHGGTAWLHRLKNPLPDDPDQAEIAILLDGGKTEWWLTTLAYASIVLVAFESDSNNRRVLKLAYDESMSTSPRFMTRLGWYSFNTWLISPFIQSGRYHLEIKAPPDFRLTRAALADSRSNYATAAGFRRRAHLRIDNANDSGGAIADFGLRVSGRGVLGGALVAALLVLLAVLACIVFSKNIASNSSSAPALLLVLPGAIATYVARPDQHGLTTRLLAIPRWILLLGAGVAAYYAAGILALAEPVGGSLTVSEKSAAIKLWMLPAAAAALAASGVILVGWICTRELTHRIRERASRLWAKGKKTEFRLHKTLCIPVDTAWEHVTGSRSPGLLPSHRVDVATETDISGHKYSASRYAKSISWDHGIEVIEAPQGTTLKWVFWATSPPLLRFLVGPFVLRERRLARKQVRALELAVASEPGGGA